MTLNKAELTARREAALKIIEGTLANAAVDLPHYTEFYAVGSVQGSSDEKAFFWVVSLDMTSATGGWISEEGVFLDDLSDQLLESDFVFDKIVVGSLESRYEIGFEWDSGLEATDTRPQQEQGWSSKVFPEYDGTDIQTNIDELEIFEMVASKKEN